MAILQPTDVLRLLKERPSKKLLEAAEDMHEKLDVHINGIGLSSYLTQVMTYEKPESLALRKQYAKSNKDLFERLSRPVDKVFCARGGGRIYNIEGEGKSKEFEQILLDVEHGYSSRRWVETFWKPRYFDDPMGLIFMEVSATGEAYPTYKCSDDIEEISLEGRKLNYVIFEIETEQDDDKRFRVVDDAFDTLYEVNIQNENSTIKVIDRFPNYFGFVPGIIISDIPMAAMEDMYASPFDSVIELADEYLRDGSIRNIYKFKHGFPKAWKYREMCGDCKGTGAKGAHACSSCNGTGKKLDSTVAEIMVLDWPTGEDKVIAPDVMGYISPALEYLDKSREELQKLEDFMYNTHWGTEQVKQSTSGNPETATGRFIDAQPVNERLSKYADAAEVIEKFIVDCLGVFYYGDAYKGCTITYGRRFIVEGPDQLWNKYDLARKNGAPIHALDEHLREYLEAKFQANSLELYKYMKMARIEPFIHYTAEQVAKFTSGADLARKIYFSEWAATIKEAEWLSVKDEELKQRLTDFAINRYEPGAATPQVA